MHPPTKIAIRDGPQHEMNMIRHETISQHIHRKAFYRTGHQSHECIVVAFVVKHDSLCVSSIVDVVTEAAD